MANRRGNPRSRKNTGRDPGQFIALPMIVLKSPAYLGLSAHARSLLLEVALQFNGHDNGRMLLSRAHLLPRGWKSSDMITKAKRELLQAGFIFETVMGHRPNKASWYAVTWQSLDKLLGFDSGAADAFERSAYRKTVPAPVCAKNAPLRPHPGTAKRVVAPHGGTRSLPPVPPRGVKHVADALPLVPPHGHPIDEPYVRVGIGEVGGDDVLSTQRSKIRKRVHAVISADPANQVADLDLQRAGAPR